MKELDEINMDIKRLEECILSNENTRNDKIKNRDIKRNHLLLSTDFKELGITNEAGRKAYLDKEVASDNEAINNIEKNIKNFNIYLRFQERKLKIRLALLNRGE